MTRAGEQSNPSPARSTPPGELHTAVVMLWMSVLAYGLGLALVAIAPELARRISTTVPVGYFAEVWAQWVRAVIVAAGLVVLALVRFRPGGAGLLAGLLAVSGGLVGWSAFSLLALLDLDGQSADGRVQAVIMALVGLVWCMIMFGLLVRRRVREYYFGAVPRAWSTTPISTPPNRISAVATLLWIGFGMAALVTGIYVTELIDNPAALSLRLTIVIAGSLAVAFLVLAIKLNSGARWVHTAIRLLMLLLLAEQLALLITQPLDIGAWLVGGLAIAVLILLDGDTVAARQ